MSREAQARVPPWPATKAGLGEMNAADLVIRAALDWPSHVCPIFGGSAAGWSGWVR